MNNSNEPLRRDIEELEDRSMTKIEEKLWETIKETEAKCDKLAKARETTLCQLETTTVQWLADKAERDALRARVHQLELECEEKMDCIVLFEKERDALKAERDSLRADLEEALRKLEHARLFGDDIPIGGDNPNE